MREAPQHPLDAPCVCGSERAYHLVDLSNPDALEIPLIVRCAQCFREISRHTSEGVTYPATTVGEG